MEWFTLRKCLGLMLVMVAMCSGCASHSKRADAGVEPNKDPLEGLNRKVFAFNDALDGWILKPVAKGYRIVTPDPVEAGVGNFFSNLAEIPSALNNILQWKWKKVGNNTGRFLLNSTVGLAGLFDVANSAGLERKEHETFGQTLSYWGLGSGPYLVLPFMGPSTLTDVIGEPVDWYSDPVYYVPDEGTRNWMRVVSTVDGRARLLSAEDFISGDKYTFIREAFLQRREYLVNDGQVEDDFGGDFDDFDNEDFDVDF